MQKFIMYFPSGICKGSYASSSNTWELCCLRDKLVNKTVVHIGGIVNVHSNHWMSFVIHLPEMMICIGDSLYRLVHENDASMSGRMIAKTLLVWITTSYELT